MDERMPHRFMEMKMINPQRTDFKDTQKSKTKKKSKVSIPLSSRNCLLTLTI